MSFLDHVDRNWPLVSRLMGAHTFVYKASGGRLGHRFPILLGAPMLLLDHVGAKSGTKRTSPLLYIPIGNGSDDVFIVASKGGYPKHPAWFHNLKANPDTNVQIGREHRVVHARVATAPERERLWPKAVELYPNYAAYQRRSKGREIPLVILERR